MSKAQNKRAPTNFVVPKNFVLDESDEDSQTKNEISDVSSLDSDSEGSDSSEEIEYNAKKFGKQKGEESEGSVSEDDYAEENHSDSEDDYEGEEQGGEESEEISDMDESDEDKPSIKKKHKMARIVDDSSQFSAIDIRSSTGSLMVANPKPDNCIYWWFHNKDNFSLHDLLMKISPEQKQTRQTLSMEWFCSSCAQAFWASLNGEDYEDEDLPCLRSTRSNMQWQTFRIKHKSAIQKHITVTKPTLAVAVPKRAGVLQTSNSEGSSSIAHNIVHNNDGNEVNEQLFDRDLNVPQPQSFVSTGSDGVQDVITGNETNNYLVLMWFRNELQSILAEKEKY